MDGRTSVLNDLQPNKGGKSVIYVISRDIRLDDNHALIKAQQSAIKHKVPLIVVFNLLRKSSYRSYEHFFFLINSLEELEKKLQKHSINLIINFSKNYDDFYRFILQYEPNEIFFDFSPLRGPRNMQKYISKNVFCRVSVVDNHNIVPVWVASQKEEYAAHTLRPKLHKQLKKYFIDTEKLIKHPYVYEKLQIINWQEVYDKIAEIPKNGSSFFFEPGEDSAKHNLRTFIDNKLPNYAIYKNDPTKNNQSDLSPYLHFGNISSLRVVLEIINKYDKIPQLFTDPKMPKLIENDLLQSSIDMFVEEIIVRKELSDNFCLYNNNYDNFDGAKKWAKESLVFHASDEREYIYDKYQLENASTHENAWNACQNQLIKTGKMHGYMRMYWAKKILEWTESPKKAIEFAIYLNDKYSIDGGDPNGYTGIMWSIVGIHDRPWFERQIFGKIRYMNYSGLIKKFDIKKYEQIWLKQK